MSSLKDDLQQFLDSNIKNDQDLNLAHVQSLLKSRKKEQALLDTKLQTLDTETRAILSSSLQETEKHNETLDQLVTLSKETESQIDTFVKDTSLVENTPKANLLEGLTALEQKLKTIDHAKGYIKALLVTSELSSQAMDLVKTQPDQAMIPYHQLVKFERYIKDQSLEQQHYKSLSEHLAKSRMRLWEELDAVLTKNFKEALDTLSWPTPIKPPYGPQLKEKLKDFEKTFENLLILQKPYENETKDVISSPIAIMLEGLSLRFRFHFETSKPTNRIDKPEWYLTHVKNTISTHLPFLMTTVQPILVSNNTGIVVKDQFIHGLLEDVTRKLQKTMPQLINHPNWLSHTIHQVLQFDKSLQDDFAYDQYTTLSNVVLNNPSWFNAWFQGEKAFAQTRYDEIMLDRQAFDIYPEDNSFTKRTKSAVRLINLLENVTMAYNLVPQLSQKMPFFVDIQLYLLSQYQKRLSTAVDSFEALSLIRSVPVPGALPEAVTGVMTATETGGTVSALNRLYRWWTSGKSMVDIIKDWKEDEFFLEMQFELNLQDLDEKYQPYAQGLFSDTLLTYDELNQCIEKIVVKLAIKEWTAETRKYAKKDTWWTNQQSSNNEISEELYRPLQDLRVTFNYLFSILPQHDFLQVYRKTQQNIEDWYWKNIITQNQFSNTGALQLETDLKHGLWKIGQRWVSKPENYTKRLKEAIQLLTLPFSNEEEHSCDKLMKALADPSQLAFVQESLQKIGIEVLSNSQIRDVLRRRNDMLYSWN